MKKWYLSDRQITIIEHVLTALVALFPLLNSFPYRVNIFLSWEGAYRLYLGQVPYQDFGLPMGFGYWVIPALAFKVFGPFLYSLVKAQVFINILSGLAFRSILKSFRLDAGLRLTAVFLFIVSYSLFNFWPWYNHSVIVYSLVGFSFLLKFLFRANTSWRSYIYISLATFFLFFSFFTKQDAGALAFMIGLFITIYHVIIDKRYKDLLLFIGTYGIWVGVFFVPFLTHGITYWFNLGQEPHYSRVELWDFIDTTLDESMWEKFYLCGFILLLLLRRKHLKSFFQDKVAFTFFLFSLGILVEALLFKVTSYTPPNNNIFFHSFMFAYFLSVAPINFSFKKIPYLATMCAMVLLLWSGAYWKYFERKVQRLFPSATEVEADKISKNTFMQTSDTSNIGMQNWVFSDLKSFEKIYMPESTVEGMNRILEMKEVQKENPQVLNMTELTPLAYEMGITPEKGRPLWYHKGVGIFDKQIAVYIEEIQNDRYDLVLFETIPYLNNFYPDEIRATLRKEYQQVDEFLAPRRPTDSYIEVYVRKDAVEQ